MKFFKFAGVVALAVALSACGQRVEIPPANVGKIMTSSGYKAGTIGTSTIRLDACLPWEACQRLVLMNSGDVAVQEPMVLLMPKDKLNMTFVLQTTLTLNPKKYDEVFARVPPENGTTISRTAVYNTYAQQIIRSETREFLSRYSIAEVLSNLDTINADLQKALTASISEKTPFIPRFVGLADIKYPKIIVESQENAASRREQIEQENAQLEISKVQIAREMQEQQLRRKVSIEKAEAEAAVNKIISESMDNRYLKYRELEVMEIMAKSPNKVFVPVGSLNSIAVQSNIGR